jgi:ribonuclease Z
MHITLLGTGTPLLDLQRHAASLLLDIGADRLVFDAGRGVTTQLLRAGVHPHQVNSIFITHHHYDHIGELGDLLLTAWHYGRHAPVQVYGPPGTTAIIDALLTQVYARDIAFTQFTTPTMPDIRQLVQVTDGAPGLLAAAPRWQVYAEYVDHGNTFGLSSADWPCFGYRIEADDKRVAISGDTIACAGLDRLAHEVDVLVQCSYLATAELTTPDMVHVTTHIIASAEQAGEIAARNHVKKLVLTHIRPKSNALVQAMVTDAAQYYAGEVVIGEDLMKLVV